MGDQGGVSNTGDFLIVVCHALYSPWVEILNDGQLKTWAKPGSQNVVHAHGIPTSKILRKLDVKYWDLKWSNRWGKIVTVVEFLLSPLMNRSIPDVHTSQLHIGVDSITIEMIDFNFLMNKKTLALLKYGAAQDYKHIVFTTSSSYLNIIPLQRELAKLPPSNVVAGRIIERDGSQFPSGSFRVFSPDVLNEVLQNLEGYKYWLPEDLALGKILSKLNLKFFHLGSLDLETPDSIDSLTEYNLINVPHFRLKSDVDGRRIDVELMERLHARMMNRRTT